MPRDVVNFRVAFFASLIIVLILVGALGFLLAEPNEKTVTATSTVISTSRTLVPELSNVTIAETVDTYLGTGPVAMAQQQKMFSSVGLTTNLITTPNALQALEAGQVQFAISPPAFAADAEGGDIISVGTLLPTYPAAIIAKPNITSLNQLDGKPLGCLTAGQLLCITDELLIRSQNWTDTPGLVEPLGTSSALEAAFENGEVQGFVFDWAVAVQLQQQGEANILGSVSQFVPAWYAGTIVTTTQFASTHPNTVKVFLASIYQAQLWITQNPNATEDWLMNKYHYTPLAAQTVYNNTEFSLTGAMDSSVVKFMYNETASALGLPSMNWQSTFTNQYLPSITYVASA